MRSALPAGEVVFCFTDVEGSTQLAHDLGAGFAELNDEHRHVVRAAVAEHRGVEVSTHGDAFFVVFTTSTDGADAAQRIHRDLQRLPIRVRIGLHAGTAPLVDGTYIGTEVNRAARIGDAAHGGQTLVSSSVKHELVGVELTDMGQHRLKGFVEPLPLFQLGPGAFPPLRTLRQRTLPVPADSFVGRAADVERLLALVASGGRLITIVGAGGTGKTRLLVETASRCEEKFAGGVHWVPLADVDAAPRVPGEIAHVLGAETLEQLPGRIGEAATLLLLDNAEHLVPAIADPISEALRLCPTLTILVTSRERLRVPGEQLLPLQPLGKDAAAELFLARARQLNPLYDEANAAVAALCTKLDGLPLAIELAAARTTLMTVTQLTERLADRLDVLKSGDRDPRQRTLQATVEWSYALLTDEQRSTHARMSIFAGGCTLDSAEAITGAGPDEWQSLVEKSLLEVDHHFAQTRLTMLETVRSVAAAELASMGGDDQLLDRYIDHYLVALEQHDEVVRAGATQLGALRWFDEELANLRHAFDRAESAGDGHRAARIAAASAWSLGLRDVRAAYALRARALALPFDDAALRIRLLAGVAGLALLVGEADALPELIAEAARVAEASGDPFLIATALETRAYTVPYAEARPLLEQVVATMHELGAHEEEVRAAINLGAIALAAFAWSDASVQLEYALELVRATGNRDGIATTSINLAQALLQLGDDTRAQALAADTRELAIELGDRTLKPICDFVDAVVAVRSGDGEAATASYTSGERALEELSLTLEPAEEELRRLARNLVRG